HPGMAILRLPVLLHHGSRHERRAFFGVDHWRKSECRSTNPKQVRITNYQCPILTPRALGHLVIVYWDLFRISSFGFRICFGSHGPVPFVQLRSLTMRTRLPRARKTTSVM